MAVVRGRVLTGLSLTLVAACTAGLEEESTAGGPLVPTLQVAVERDSVIFELHVTNVSEEAVVLEFPTAQRFDFVVERAGGERVWAWSEGRMFAQVLGEERVQPGATLHYRAAWKPPAALSGTYRARGVIPARERRIEITEEFELR